MLHLASEPICTITYTNKRSIDRIVSVDRRRAETYLGMIELPKSERIETGMRLNQLALHIIANHRPLNLSLKVGVNIRNTRTGLVEAVKHDLQLRDVMFLAHCLIDPRDSAFETMASGLRKFIADGSVSLLHPFFESEMGKKLVI